MNDYKRLLRVIECRKWLESGRLNDNRLLGKWLVGLWVSGKWSVGQWVGSFNKTCGLIWSIIP